MVAGCRRETRGMSTWLHCLVKLVAAWVWAEGTAGDGRKLSIVSPSRDSRLSCCQITQQPCASGHLAEADVIYSGVLRGETDTPQVQAEKAESEVTMPSSELTSLI
jgi:hypothetical protein